MAATVPLRLQIPEQNGIASHELLSPPTTSPKKPPIGRPILPMKKSKTLPINFDERVPPKPPTALLNGKRLFATKPLKELHTVSATDNGRLLVARSPSPAYRRSMSSASVETGSIAELAKRHTPSNYLTSRSPSPSVSLKSSSQYTTCSSSNTYVPLSRSTSTNSYNRTPTPRRTFPQYSNNYDTMSLKEFKSKEQAPVIFDAHMSFVLGCNRQPVRQNFKPVAAHLDEGTASNFLSNKIDNFLRRTDHVMDEWRHLGHKDEADLDVYCNGKKRKVGRSKSATNIMIKGFTMFSRSGSRTSSVCMSNRGISEDRTTVSEMDEVCQVAICLASYSKLS